MKRKMRRMTDLEQDIMSVLWSHAEALTNKEIVKYLEERGKHYLVDSVNHAITKLIKDKIVEVSGMKPSGSVYARTFLPLIKKEEYLQTELDHIRGIFSPDGRIGTFGLVQMILGAQDSYSEKEREEIEQILEKAKTILERGK